MVANTRYVIRQKPTLEMVDRAVVVKHIYIAALVTGCALICKAPEITFSLEQQPPRFTASTVFDPSIDPCLRTRSATRESAARESESPGA
jgi:hypothetical protein